GLERSSNDLDGDYGFRLEGLRAAHSNFERDSFASNENIRRNYLQIELALLGAALQIIRDDLIEIQADLAAVAHGLATGGLGGWRLLLGSQGFGTATAAGGLRCFGARSLSSVGLRWWRRLYC